MNGEEAAASCAGIWMRAPALSPHCNLSNAYSSLMPGRLSHLEGHPLWGCAATGAVCSVHGMRTEMLSKYPPELQHYITLASCYSIPVDLSNVTQLKQIVGQLLLT